MKASEISLRQEVRERRKSCKSQHAQHLSLSTLRDEPVGKA